MSLSPAWAQPTTSGGAGNGSVDDPQIVHCRLVAGSQAPGDRVYRRQVGTTLDHGQHGLPVGSGLDDLAEEPAALGQWRDRLEQRAMARL